MNRRRAILSCLALPLLAGGARAGLERHYRVSLLAGNYADGRHLAGVHVELDGLWKTYWRVSGDAGIPPQFDWSGSQNAAAVELRYPLPIATATPPEIHRLQGSCPVSGFRHTRDPDKPVRLRLDLFFAVCDVICIPGKANASIDLAWQVRILLRRR
jgi:DsbC/DsbD-like thiol-disulfide interchange protein